MFLRTEAVKQCDQPSGWMLLMFMDVIVDLWSFLRTFAFFFFFALNNKITHELFPTHSAYYCHERA